MGVKNWDKNIETFGTYVLFTVTATSEIYSPYVFLGLEISTAIAESMWRFDFVYIISLFTFDSSIVLSLITIYLYINTSYPHKNNN